MALTRKMLAAFGIEQNVIDQIIEAHVEVTDGQKKEIEDLKKQVETLGKSGENYEKLKTEFETYKKDMTEKETTAKKKELLTKIAKDAGLSEAGVAKAVKYSDLSTLEIDDDGNAKNAKDILKSLKEEWGEYVQTKKTEGAKTPTPPANTNTTHALTKAEIMKIKDTTERQKAWGEYLRAQKE